jgi:hypothetical protein
VNTKWRKPFAFKRLECNQHVKLLYIEEYLNVIYKNCIINPLFYPKEIMEEKTELRCHSHQTIR